jgi:hypothetical protein
MFAPNAASPAVRGGRPRRTTPAQLRRLLIVLLACTVLFWVTATILQRGMQSVTQSVRDTTSPAYLDAIQARAALSDADRAAWQSFRSGAAQLTGPGQQYQNDITNAGQAIERLAALGTPGSPENSLLQTISGQLVNYQGLVEQADAEYRRDIALGTASRGDLGFAYLTYASNAMRDPQGGLLASIDQLAGPEQQALRGQLASPWADPALLLVLAVPALCTLAGIAAAQAFLRRRFNRAVSLPLLLAAAAACALSGWLITATLHADSAFAAARTTALPRLTGLWQAQIRTVDAEAAALRAGMPPVSSGGLDVMATQRAGSAFGADMTSATAADGLPAGIPALAAAIAVLGYLGFRPRLNEYRRLQ